jgi:hypothetical protein
VDGCTAFYVGIIGSRLFGLQDNVRVQQHLNGNGVETTEVDWSSYVWRKQCRKVVANSQDQITNEIHELEKRMQKQHMKAGEEASTTAEQGIVEMMLHRYGCGSYAQKPR